MSNSNKIQIFNNDAFGEIRTMVINDEPWFAGKDVALALGYSRATDAIRKRIQDDDRGVAKMETPQGTKQNMTIINESGLYSLIFGSKLPSAKQFKRWVTSEVLPQIRRTGGYIPLSPDDDEKTILAKALKIQERTLREKDDIIQSKTKALSIAQPKAEKYDKLMSLDGYFSFNVAAKELGVGRNKLMKLLRERGILFRDGLSNIAYQKYCNSGYFVVKFSVGKNGWVCGVTKVTPKVLDFLYRVVNDERSDITLIS